MREVAISMNSKCHAETHYFVTQANLAQQNIKFRDVFIPPPKQELFASQHGDDRDAFIKAFALKQELNLRPEDILIVVVDGNLYDHENDEYFFIDSVECPDLGDTTRDRVGLISVYYLEASSSFMKDRRREWDVLSEMERKTTLSQLITLLTLGITATILSPESMILHDEVIGCVMDYCQTPIDVYESLKQGFQFCDECTRVLQQSDEGRSVIKIAAWLNQKPYGGNPLTQEEPLVARLTKRASFIETDSLKENVCEAISYLDVEHVDIGLFLLSREFETVLSKYLKRARAFGRLHSTLPTHLTMSAMISILNREGIITDRAILAFLKEKRNERAHSSMPSLAERKLLMNNAEFVAGLYIDWIKYFDDLYMSLHKKQ